MPRLSVHPVPESFIHNIEDLAFKHFKQQESLKDHRLAFHFLTSDYALLIYGRTEQYPVQM